MFELQGGPLSAVIPARQAILVKNPNQARVNQLEALALAGLQAEGKARVVILQRQRIAAQRAAVGEVEVAFEVHLQSSFGWPCSKRWVAGASASSAW